MNAAQTIEKQGTTEWLPFTVISGVQVGWADEGVPDEWVVTGITDDDEMVVAKIYSDYYPSRRYGYIDCWDVHSWITIENMGDLPGAFNAMVSF